MPEVITFVSPRDPKIYRGPLVVAVRGIGREGFKAAFAASDVIYTEEYYGFTLPRSAGIRPARYLNAILNSSLATYYLFLTSSVWGIERDKVEPNDLLSLPIPRIEESRKREIDTVLKAEQAIRSSLANDETPTNHMLSQLDEAVFNLFDLDETERVLVRDTVSLTINLRMKHTRSIALKRPSMTEVELYAKQLINIIQPFLETLNERTMTADVFDVGRAPLQVVRLNMLPALGHSPGTSIVDGQDLDAILGKIAQQLPNRIAGSVYARRVLRIYSNDALYIIKPAQLRYWSRSSGLNDADAIIAEHMRTAHDLA